MLFQRRSRHRKSLRHWATMAKVINQVKSIDGVIAENLIRQDNRFSALERSMYKQFPWQTRSEFYDIVKSTRYIVTLSYRS